MSDDEDFGLGGVFPEEERPPPPPPDIKYYTRPNGQELSIQLVTTHPLWGHVLYPTSICLADYLAKHAEELVKNKNVLELGAGGGLPSLVCALEGAKKTVVTDFPDSSLISNLQRNIDANIPAESQASIIAEGYTWGSKVDKLIRHLDNPEKGFNTILAADLVFNHSQHLALLKTCEACFSGSERPVLLCFYSHHRPTKELIAKDEGFVKLAEERGWKAERVVRKTDAGPAFPEDGGDLAIRSTVHGFKLTPPGSNAQA
ncbi:hypothetical protein P389DRAFT_2672 [Cystobasidium minutum MCA 4210]|uniref:uncharacterized protein n=1 Tax=Cystobasidium minutum MCA 4210 TaxID=1397322 RepID=UPI0034D01292|eukprot:jgi/Rhomi1/2672/CE2671_673